MTVTYTHTTTEYIWTIVVLITIGVGFCVLGIAFVRNAYRWGTGAQRAMGAQVPSKAQPIWRFISLGIPDDSPFWTMRLYWAAFLAWLSGMAMLALGLISLWGMLQGWK